MSLDHAPLGEVFRNAANPETARGSESQPRPQSKPKPTPAPPFSLRLSVAEKAELLRRAGNVPLGRYVRAQLLGDGVSARRALRKPVADDEALARLLGELGKGRLSANLNQLAKAANCGALPVTPETEAALNDACRDVRWMRDTLVSALGLRSAP